MPWTSDSGRTYQLALFDTNALSAIGKHPEAEGAGFRRLLASGRVAPCITPYNLVELHRATELFADFLGLFGQVPIFLTKPWELLLDDEIRAQEARQALSPILQAFTPDGPDDSYDLPQLVRRVFADPEIQEVIRKGDYEVSATVILDAWKANAANFEPRNRVANARDADVFVQEAGIQTLISIRADWTASQIHKGSVPSIRDFPSLMVMLYSIYWRIWDPAWRGEAADVMDVRIAALAPYADLFFTETYQAEVLSKARKRVPGLERLRVHRLKDLRNGEV